VVTASRVPENYLKSPVAMKNWTFVQSGNRLRQAFMTPRKCKGCADDYFKLTFKFPIQEDLISLTTFRFMQLVDGVDMQAATLGVPLGNAIGQPN
jgi:hypothetical protein